MLTDVEDDCNAFLCLHRYFQTYLTKNKKTLKKGDP